MFAPFDPDESRADRLERALDIALQQRDDAYKQIAHLKHQIAMAELEIRRIIVKLERSQR